MSQEAPQDPRQPLAIPLPLHCIDLAPASPTIGEPCPDCPLIAQGLGCRALRAGVAIAQQREEITELTEANRQGQLDYKLLLERLLNLRLDALVNTAFTPKGLRDHLSEDEAIREELKQRQWGVIRLDGRFVHYINRFGVEVGDEFLTAGGAEITSVSDGLVRVQADRRRQQQPIEANQRTKQRRQGHSLVYDLICRQGGDEFALLIRNVDAAQLTRIAARVRNQLTVAQAIERYGEGKIPFIASVGYAHATSAEIAPEVTGLLGHNHHWEAFYKVSKLADEGQRAAKSRQYDEMWEVTVASMDPDQRPTTVTRPNDREVAETFLRVMCPDFMVDPVAFLIRQNREGETNHENEV